MGESIYKGLAKSGDVPPLEGAFVTGANLRSYSKTKSTTPPGRKAGAKAAAKPARSSNPKPQGR